MKYLVFLLLLGTTQWSCNLVTDSDFKSNSDRPYVVLISFDGFSHEYVSLYDTPNLDKFILGGTSASRMVSSYPSKTFPNHYTMVTGLYPGNHGLIDNSFYDRQRKEVYRVSDRTKVEDEYYYGGTPLWQLVQQGGMKSASYFWVGSEAPVSGSFPDFYKIYDGKVPNEERINVVLDWLKLEEEERPNFVSLYFSFIDDVGHEYGPYSEEMAEAVVEADRLVGLLLDKMSSLSFKPNVILVSDHGMMPMDNDPDTFIPFDKLINLENPAFLGVNNGTHGHVYAITADNSQVDSLYNSLKLSAELGYGVYKHDNLPEHWNFENDRVGDIFMVADPGKYLTRSSRNIDSWEEEWGTHGFDPYVCEEVGAIFYANGPNIAVNKKIEEFQNIHLYPLIAEIFGLTIPEIDGRLEVLQPIIVNETQ